MVCRRRRPEAELLRLGRDASGTWYVGRGNGRGVWWCADGCGSSVRISQVAHALHASVSEADMAVVRDLAVGKRP
ncbi:MAG: hypothetical protein ABSG58_00125 [Acidimicrobiales bacterium]